AVRRRWGLSVTPRFLWECLTSPTVRPFPAPATSNGASGFPALRFPVRFTPRLMRPILLAALWAVASPGSRRTAPGRRTATAYSACPNRSPDASGRASGATPEAPGLLGLRLGVD